MTGPTSWAAVAAEHADHWLRLDGPTRLRCHPCNRLLLLPLRTDQHETPTPPPFAPPTEPPATPEVVADAKRRAAEALALVRQRRTEAP